VTSSGFVDEGDRVDPTRGRGTSPDNIADPGSVGLAGRTGYMTIAAARTTAAIPLVLIVRTITFALLTAAEYSGSAVLAIAGGWAGIVDGALARYASLAAVTNSTFKKTVLPVVPLAERDEPMPARRSRRGWRGEENGERGGQRRRRDQAHHR
jgi:hypothetical protein